MEEHYVIAVNKFAENRFFLVCKTGILYKIPVLQTRKNLRDASLLPLQCVPFELAVNTSARRAFLQQLSTGFPPPPKEGFFATADNKFCFATAVKNFCYGLLWSPAPRVRAILLRNPNTAKARPCTVPCTNLTRALSLARSLSLSLALSLSRALSLSHTHTFSLSLSLSLSLSPTLHTHTHTHTHTATARLC